MSMRTHIYSLLLFVIVLSSCKNNRNIVNAGDYNQYMRSASSKKLGEIDTELKFWTDRLKKNPEDLASQSKIAGLTGKRFSFSGNITEVHFADSLYREINKINRSFTSGTYRALAANDITQHRFREAGAFIDTALKMGDDKYVSVLMEIDIAMELGDMYRARTALASLKDKNDFAYLVRSAKIHDHIGEGEEAISILKQALKNLNPEFDKANYLWAKTNLGDWLGHNNHFKESYQSYLDALQVEPENHHALKGIAWLAFAHDRNTTEAKRILIYLMKVHPVPDYKLMMGEIAAYENNTAEKEKYWTEFIAEVSDPSYGDMYNKYVFSLQADELKNYKEALRIAKREVDNRPTALSYDMLAYSLYKTGDIENANAIVKKYVAKKCFEPFSIYHQGLIYKAAGDKMKAKKQLRLAAESEFELGPLKASIIQKELSDI